MTLAAAWPLAAYSTGTADHQIPVAIQGDPAVSDSRYNLIWEVKSANPDAINYKDRLFDWFDAQRYARHLNEISYAGQSDWRVPSAMEMATLIDTGVGEPCINTQAFPHNGNYHYWTSSQFPPLPSVATYTSFIAGAQFKWSKYGRMRGRCVAGGGWSASYPGNMDSFRLLEKLPGNPSVHDQVTGLEWETKAWHGDAARCHGQLFGQLKKVWQFPSHITQWGAPLIDEYRRSGLIGDQWASAIPALVALGFDMGYAAVVYPLGVCKELRKQPLSTKSLLGGRSYLNVYSYEQALEYVDSLNRMNGGKGYAGHNDWRLPAMDEFITTADWNRVPCTKEVFSPSFPWLYWTATPVPEGSRHYWSCRAGSVIGNYAPDSGPLLVIAVRGKMRPPEHLTPVVADRPKTGKNTYSSQR